MSDEILRAEPRFDCGDLECPGELVCADVETWWCDACDRLYVPDGNGLTHFPEEATP